MANSGHAYSAGKLDQSLQQRFLRLLGGSGDPDPLVGRLRDMFGTDERPNTSCGSGKRDARRCRERRMPELFAARLRATLGGRGGCRDERLSYASSMRCSSRLGITSRARGRSEVVVGL